MFAAGFGDYSYGKGEFQAPKPCCVTSHKAPHSAEEKYLWFWVTEGRAVAAPPVFSSVFELSARHRMTLTRIYCVFCLGGNTF